MGKTPCVTSQSLIRCGSKTSEMCRDPVKNSRGQAGDKRATQKAASYVH